MKAPVPEEADSGSSPEMTGWAGLMVKIKWDDIPLELIITTQSVPE